MTKVRNTRKEYMISVNNEQSIFEDTKESTLKRSAKKLKERNWSVSHQYPISNLKENNSLASNSGGFPSSNFENSLKNKVDTKYNTLRNSESGNPYESTKQRDFIIHHSAVKAEMSMSSDNDRIKELEQRYNELDKRTVSETFIKFFRQII